MYDVIGIETPCMDFALNVDSLPTSNDDNKVFNDYTWQGGGKVSTGIVAAARLGAKCMIMGSVGDDLFSRFCIADFKRHGIDVSEMVVRKGKTLTLSVVLSDLKTQGRSMLFKIGDAENLTHEEIDLELVKQTKYFFLSHLNNYNIPIAKAVRSAGGKVFMDADHPHVGMIENMGLVNVFVASEFVYDSMFPEGGEYETNCRLVREMGPEIVVFTFGAKGCMGISEDGFFDIPAFKVKVVDTLGAGDVFHGAFLAGMIRGWNVQDTASFASAVSAIKCTRTGGRAGIPDFDTTMRFIETGEIDYSEIDERVEFYKRGLEHV